MAKIPALQKLTHMMLISYKRLVYVYMYRSLFHVVLSRFLKTIKVQSHTII